jgi:ABC-type sugar transport system permease subunit
VLFLLPALILLAIVMLVPASIAIFRSLYNWDPGYESPFVGLENFTTVLSDPVFHQAVGNQLFLLLGVPLWTLLPLLISVFLYERVAWPGLFRAVYFFPSILSTAVIAIVFREMLAPKGSLNEVLDRIGLGFLAQSWIDDPAIVKLTLIVVLAWASVGTGVMIISAALSAVPIELIEAARVEGANWWQRLRHVFLPAVLPVVVFWAVYQVISVFLWVFTWIYVLTSGGPGYSSTTTDYLIYTQIFRDGTFGTGAAMSVLLLGIVVFLLAGGWVLRTLVLRRVA